jgi:Holliday junction resolvasome RuvABC endonuclease subunit
LSDMAMGLSDSVPPRSLLADLPGPVWGIDPSTERISLGIISPGAWPNIEARTLSLQQGGDHPGVRLARAENALVSFFEHLAHIERAGLLGPEDEERRVPVALAVEEPFGGGHAAPPVQLQMMCGMVLAAVWRTFGTQTKVLMKGKGANIGVPPGTWKAQAMGAGNGRAKKPAITAWAQDACGWPGVSPTRPQDEADALGIATWAAMEVVRAKV